MKFFKSYSIFITSFFVLLVFGAMIFVEDATKPVNNDSSNLTTSIPESQKQSSTQKSSSGGSPLANPSSNVVPIGTLAKVRKDYAIRIEGSEVVDSISVEHPFMKVVTGNGEYLLVVYVTFKNIGSESGNMTSQRFQLVDDQARKYDEIENAGEKLTVWSWLDSKELSKAEDQLSAGSTAKTAKVFRVAPDAVGLKMMVNNITFSLK